MMTDRLFTRIVRVGGTTTIIVACLLFVSTPFRAKSWWTFDWTDALYVAAQSAVFTIGTLIVWHMPLPGDRP